MQKNTSPVRFHPADIAIIGAVVLMFVMLAWGIMQVGLQQPKGDPLGDFVHRVVGSTTYNEAPSKSSY